MTSPATTYEAVVYVFANISGLLTFHPDGVVHSCNHYFSMSMIGRGQDQVIGKPITQLIPDFYDELDMIDLDSMPLPPVDADDVIFSGHEPVDGAQDFRPLSFDDDEEVVTIGQNGGTGQSATSDHLIGRDDIQSATSDHVIGRDDIQSATSDHGIGQSINTSGGSGDSDEKEQAELEKLGTGELLLLASEAIAQARLSPLNDSVKTDDLFDEPDTDEPPGRAEVPRPSVSQSGMRISTPVRVDSAHDLQQQAQLGTPKRRSLPNNGELMTSTPAPGKPQAGQIGLSRQTSQAAIPEGNYCGQCRHRDGNMIAVIYQIKRVALQGGETLYAMWICRDPEDPAVTYTLASSFNSTMDQSYTSLNFHKEISRVNDSPLPSQPIPEREEDLEVSSSTTSAPEEEEEDLLPPDNGYLSSGRYDDLYETHQSIGKGAFGFVKLGRRKKDGKDVVVKFIKKAKVLTECWVQTEKGRVPLELSLLTTLAHTNIVSLLGAYESDDFFHLVMEKHGQGMDLFEFIDRYPNMDEPLISYMFRQMVDAVDYLHALNIIHRDIKDENIILNQKFHVKLIDFGSAAFMEEGTVFGTFCGTVEYCSPEVLMGNKYRGPELEMWSLGVTLYTLVFGENPFYDIDETIKAVLKPPFKVSVALMDVIGWLLARDPRKRATTVDLQRHLWVTQPVDISLYDFKDVLPNYEFHGNVASDHRPDDSMDDPRSKDAPPPPPLLDDVDGPPPPLPSSAPPLLPSDGAGEPCEDTDMLLNELERCLHLDDRDRRTLSV